MQSTMLLPRRDSGLECAIGVPGREDVLLIVGGNIFFKENDLNIGDFPCDPPEDTPKANMSAFSTSDVWLRNLKLTLGIRLLRDGFPLADKGDELIGLRNGDLLLFTELGPGEGDMFILAKLGGDSFKVLEGISKKRLGRFLQWAGASSVIPYVSSTFKMKRKSACCHGN